MTDEKELFKAATVAVLPPQSLRETHPAIIVDHDTNGNLGLQIPSASPSATAKPVPVQYGLPAFAAVFVDGACSVALGFHEGDESKAYAGGFPHYPVRPNDAIPPPLPMPIVSLHFGGGTKPIARVDDTVGCGSMQIIQSPVGPGGVPSTLSITYQPPGGGAPTLLITFPIPGPAIIPGPNPLVATIELAGKITSGRTEFQA
jgi:hypothetical protein